jgi:cytochrome c oxidase subunit 3
MSQTALEADRLPAEQFEDLEQQHHAATLGVWVFLATEVLFFGALIVSFYLMRLVYTEPFALAARELKWWLGGINTAVLLISSFFMAMAVHAAHENDAKLVTRRLVYTGLLGIGFLVIKALEYYLEYREGLVPALKFEHHDQHLEMFMTFYFISTLLHALHVTIGIGLMLVLAWLTRGRRYGPRWFNMIEGAGLYWHFVDLVWVFLYPTLYLLRHA